MKHLPTAACLTLLACGITPVEPGPEEPVSLPSEAVGMVVGNTAGDLSLLDDLADTGVGWVRLNQAWTADIERAHDLGLRTYVSLDYVPDIPWADHVRQQVEMHPGVEVWGILNEPNEPTFADKSPAEYAKLLAVAAPIIREAGARVAAPEASQRGAAQYVREVVSLAGEHIDVLSVHYYGPAVGALEMIESLPEGYPVWLTETAHGHDQTPAQQASQLEDIFRLQAETPRWEVTLPYHWYTDRRFPVRGTEAEEVIRGVVGR